MTFFNKVWRYYYYLVGYTFWFIGLLVYYLAYYFHSYQIPAYPLFLGCLIINIVFVDFGCDIFFVGRLKYSCKGFAPFDSMVVMLNGCNLTRIAWSKKFKEPIKKYLQLSIFDL